MSWFLAIKQTEELCNSFLDGNILIDDFLNEVKDINTPNETLKGRYKYSGRRSQVLNFLRNNKECSFSNEDIAIYIKITPYAISKYTRELLHLKKIELITPKVGARFKYKYRKG